MKTAICTLYEGDYHYGVAVLTNSLYRHGFRGEVWVGYRGSLPPWATLLLPVSSFQDRGSPDRVCPDQVFSLAIAPDCTLHFVPINPPIHLANYKPDFMVDILERYSPETEAICYFDPDIVNKCDWDFYDRWLHHGIALCGDSWYEVPAHHPRRLAWIEFAAAQGFPCKRSLDYHYNSGFVGVHRRYLPLLVYWQKLIYLAGCEGHANLKDIYCAKATRTYPYVTQDQVALNIALMLTSFPLSTIGPEGMDFAPHGTTMSHATAPQVKPWRKRLVKSAIAGVPPTPTDRLFWQHSQSPIPAYDTKITRQKERGLAIASLIGRVIRRN
ncbi:MAG: hypothetical protein MUF49_02780 [Oculatellaceae cyanobacterium Prado106]|jgi:hypothetical protein|nr:hypothetical protein [Oculatellaceae cyanobacterium Prado106]